MKQKEQNNNNYYITSKRVLTLVALFYLSSWCLVTVFAVSVPRGAVGWLWYFLGVLTFIFLNLGF